MRRGQVRLLATALLLFCALVVAFSAIVALAARGELAGLAPAFDAMGFGAWVASFEFALALAGVGMVALLFVRTVDDEPEEPGPSTLVVPPTTCRACGADAEDVDLTMPGASPNCVNCGADLLASPSA